jgi:hypothetical protein
LFGMAQGPRGERRPADVMGAAIMAAMIATGEFQERLPVESVAAELGRRGGKARAASLSKKDAPRPAPLLSRSKWTKSTASLKSPLDKISGQHQKLAT